MVLTSFSFTYPLQRIQLLRTLPFIGEALQHAKTITILYCKRLLFQLVDGKGIGCRKNIFHSFIFTLTMSIHIYIECEYSFTHLMCNHIFTTYPLFLWLLHNPSFSPISSFSFSSSCNLYLDMHGADYACRI